ncbi:unnamed protein product [Ilex paraguariensis]|uniref:Uncharacterized protein n=1 Tax=Ilex paraguariensis TaxID=185542 RepID=A0ABC8U1R2_9AQUA
MDEHTIAPKIGYPSRNDKKECMHVPKGVSQPSQLTLQPTALNQQSMIQGSVAVCRLSKLSQKDEATIERSFPLTSSQANHAVQERYEPGQVSFQAKDPAERFKQSKCFSCHVTSS